MNDRPPVVDQTLAQWRMRELGLKGRQLAPYLGVSEPQLSRLLNGTRKITDAQMDVLCRALGVPRDLLDLSLRKEAA